MPGFNGGILRPHHTKLAFVHRLADMLVIAGALPLAVHIYEQPWQDYYSMVSVITMLMFIFFAKKNELYQSWRVSRIKSELYQLTGIWLSAVMGLLLILFITQTTKEYPRDVFLTWFIIPPLVMGIGRIGLRFALKQFRRRGYNTRNAAVLGVNNLGYQIGQHINRASWMGLNLTGFFDDRDPCGNRFDTPSTPDIAGDINTLINMARSGEIDIIYITLPLCAQKRINHIIEALADTTVCLYYVPDFFEFDLAHARWQTFGDFAVVNIYGTPFNGIDGWLKRIEDIVLGSIALLITSIPMAIIAIVIKMTSTGPVIFQQRRYGINGQEIQMWKFRTMTVCEDGPTIIQASSSDSRITPFGKFLRRTSLDELPQFINVLQGRMSLIGPRPHAIAHNEQYRHLIKGYMLRHKVKPGITGWAQINGYRGETDTLDKMERRIEHDLDYIRNWSLLLDLKILILTLIRGFIHKNAY